MARHEKRFSNPAYDDDELWFPGINKFHWRDWLKTLLYLPLGYATLVLCVGVFALVCGLAFWLTSMVPIWLTVFGAGAIGFMLARATTPKR